MTFKEAKEAFLCRLPVSYKGSYYQEIIRISFQYGNDGAVMETATILDKNSRTEVVIPIKEIEKWTSSE